MGKLRVSMLVAGLALAAVGCGSAEEGGSEADSTATATDESAAPTESTAPIGTTPPVVAVTTTVAAGGDAECLQGTWLQGPDRLQSFVGQIGGPMVFTVMPDSLLTLTIDGAAVDVTSTVTLQVDIGGSLMQMTGTGTYSGTMLADGSTINVTLTSQEYVAGDWLMTVDGETISVPGVEAMDPGPPVNGLADYTCTDTTLEVVASGRTSIFDRG